MMIRLAIVAALYIVLTVLISPLSYGAIQLRFSEILVLLVFYKKEYGISIVLGCFVANIFSPLGWIDMLFGTASSIFAVVTIRACKHLLVATIMPTISCIFVGIELMIVFDLPFLITTLQVMAGEFIVVTLLGYPLFKLLEKNKSFMEIIAMKKEINE